MVILWGQTVCFYYGPLPLIHLYGYLLMLYSKSILVSHSTNSLHKIYISYLFSLSPIWDKIIPYTFHYI